MLTIKKLWYLACYAETMKKRLLKLKSAYCFVPTAMLKSTKPTYPVWFMGERLELLPFHMVRLLDIRNASRSVTRAD